MGVYWSMQTYIYTAKLSALRDVRISHHLCVGEAHRAEAYAKQMGMLINTCSAVLSKTSSRTSVISNFTLPIASPSAIAKNEVRVGWPTIDARVSRCWWVSQSLSTGSQLHRQMFGRVECITISISPHDLVRSKIVHD